MGKMGHWNPELANGIKRMCHISVKTGRGSRLREMGQAALGPRIGKCHQEDVSYFSQDWEGGQIRKNEPGGTGAQNWQMS